LTPTSGYAPLVVKLDGYNSYDPDGRIVEYVWQESATGKSLLGPEVTLTFDEAGEHQVSLRVFDNLGLESQTVTATISVFVNNPPIVSIASTSDGGQVPLQVSFDGSGSTDPEGQSLSYEWTLPSGQKQVGPQVSVEISERGPYTMILTVTDGLGQSSTSDYTVLAYDESDIVLPTAQFEILTPDYNRLGDSGSNLAIEIPVSVGAVRLRPIDIDPSVQYTWTVNQIEYQGPEQLIDLQGATTHSIALFISGRTGPIDTQSASLIESATDCSSDDGDDFCLVVDSGVFAGNLLDPLASNMEIVPMGPSGAIPISMSQPSLFAKLVSADPIVKELDLSQAISMVNGNFAVSLAGLSQTIQGTWVPFKIEVQAVDAYGNLLNGSTGELWAATATLNLTNVDEIAISLKIASHESGFSTAINLSPQQAQSVRVPYGELEITSISHPGEVFKPLALLSGGVYDYEVRTISSGLSHELVNSVRLVSETLPERNLLDEYLTQTAAPKNLIQPVQRSIQQRSMENTLDCQYPSCVRSSVRPPYGLIDFAPPYSWVKPGKEISVTCSGWDQAWFQDLIGKGIAAAKEVAKLQYDGQLDNLILEAATATYSDRITECFNDPDISDPHGCAADAQAAYTAVTEPLAQAGQQRLERANALRGTLLYNPEPQFTYWLPSNLTAVLIATEIRPDGTKGNRLTVTKKIGPEFSLTEQNFNYRRLPGVLKSLRIDGIETATWHQVHISATVVSGLPPGNPYQAAIADCWMKQDPDLTVEVATNSEDPRFNSPAFFHTEYGGKFPVMVDERYGVPYASSYLEGVASVKRAREIHRLPVKLLTRAVSDSVIESFEAHWSGGTATIPIARESSIWVGLHAQSI
ncbi:MAG: PKD domain-containing protein, partial [Bdellovibrionales bacterium]|nr:PKD domain-containing protein [Bdellovibrionales bacterium]